MAKPDHHDAELSIEGGDVRVSVSWPGNDAEVTALATDLFVRIGHLVDVDAEKGIRDLAAQLEEEREDG